MHTSPASRLILLLSILAIPFSPRAQESRRFDFGGPDSRKADGYLGVSAGDYYTSRTEYGWESRGQADFDTATPPWNKIESIAPTGRGISMEMPLLYNQFSNSLRRDGVASPRDMAFRVDLPNGRYRVCAIVGDLTEPLGSLWIDCNGRNVARDVFAGHLAWHNYPISFGFFRPVRFTAEVTTGTLHIRFFGNDGKYREDKARFDRLFPHNANLQTTYQRHSYLKDRDPNVERPFDFGGPFKRNSVLGLTIKPYAEPPFAWKGAILEKGGARWSEADAFAQSVNLRDFSRAEALLERAAQSGERLADIAAGWLSLIGYPDSPSAKEEAWIEQAQQALSAADPDAWTEEAMEDLTFFKMARYRFNHRGMGQEQDPVEGRVSEEGHFLQDLRVTQLMGLIDPDSPLYIKARLFAGRAFMMLDPHRWSYSGGEGYSIFRSLAPTWPDNKYVKWYLKDEWTPDEEWKPGSYSKDVAGGPDWARKLREAHLLLLDMTEWWDKNKLQANGGIGGGWGDDVELFGLFAIYSLVHPGLSPGTAHVANEILRGLWADSEIDPAAGYCRGVYDTEHSSEWTGDTMGLALALNYGNPVWVERALKTAKLMQTLWMGRTDLKRLHFRSNYLGALNVGDGSQASDAYINFRATFPAIAGYWYSGSPSIRSLFTDWADGWVQAAMSEDRGKPKGVIPAQIGFPDNLLGGAGSPNWFTAARPAGSINYDFAVTDPALAGRGGLGSETLQYREYMIQLLAMAYEMSGEEKILEPLRLEAELAKKYTEAPIADPQPGSATWAGMILSGKNNRAYSAIDQWAAVQKAVSPGRGETTGYSVESGASVSDTVIRNVMRLWPSLTTEAASTDRVAFAQIGAPYFMMSGDGPTAASLVRNLAATYEGMGRNAVPLVELANRKQLKIRFYNFDEEPRDILVRLWRLEPGATYRLISGVDSDDNGVVDRNQEETALPLKRRGDSTRLLLPPHATSILEIIQTAPPPSAKTLLPDLAAAPEELVYNDRWREVEATIHNLGAAAAEGVEVVFSVVEASGKTREIGRAAISQIDWPSDFEPRSIRVGVRYIPQGATERIRAQVNSDLKIDEITDVNNRAEKEFKFDLGKLQGRIGPDNL